MAGDERQVPVLRRADADHRGYAHWLRRGVPGGSDRLLNRHAVRRDPPLVLVGEGLATSRRVAAWVERHQDRHPGSPLFVHHVGCTVESRDPGQLLRRLLAFIRHHCSLAESVPVDPQTCIEILPNWLARLAARGPAVVVLDRPDALEDQDAEQAMEWLPRWLPSTIRLVITVEPGVAAEMLRQRDWQLEAMDCGSSPADAAWPDEALLRQHGELLRLLACARRGLTAAELGSLLPGGTPVADVLEPWLFLAEDRLTLAGPGLRDTVRRLLLADGADRQATERYLAGLYAERADEPALDARPWLLARARDWAGLAETLSHPAVLDAMLDGDWRDELLGVWQHWGNAGELAAFYVDALSAWQRQESRIPPERLPRLIRALRDFPGHADLEPLFRAARGQRDSGDHQELAALDAMEGAWLMGVERPREAEPLLRGALEVLQPGRGPDHPDTRACRHRLAMLLEEQGDTEGAVLLYREALEHREVALGVQDPELIPHLVNLAAVLRAGNALEEARPFYQRALELAERHYGSNHPQTAACADGLAGLLYAGHDLEQAEALYQRALGIAETAFGPGHPATAASAHNLGAVLDAREQYQAAEMLFRRALDIRRQALGEEHVDTASSLHNLAGVLDAMGRYQDAEPLYRQAIGIWERVVGPEHTATATSVNNLADLLRETKAFAEAEALYRRNLDTWSRLLGPRHPHTVMTRSELAMLRADSRPGPDTELLLQEAVGETAEVMGWDSMQHINTVVRYAALLRDSRRRDEARRLLQRTLRHAEGRVSMLSPRIQKLKRHLEALDRDPDTLH